MRRFASSASTEKSWRAQVANEPEASIAFLRELSRPIEAIGLEAGPLSQWLHRELTEAGFKPVPMETRQVKAVLKAMSLKTDRHGHRRALLRRRMGQSVPEPMSVGGC